MSRVADAAAMVGALAALLDAATRRGMAASSPVYHRARAARLRVRAARLEAQGRPERARLLRALAAEHAAIAADYAKAQ